MDELDPDRRTPVVFGAGPDLVASSSPADDLEAVASSGAARPSAADPAIAAVPVADAFAALLDSEREHGVDAAHPGASDAVAMLLLPGTRVTSAFVDDVARRVIERLGEPAFREVIRDVVPAVAERLIREEIERIKASI